ncbi:MAG: cobalamin-binding protein [Burkholderiales bacterium]
MRRTCAVVLACLWPCGLAVATAAAPESAASITLKDDRGVEVRLAAPTRRIVTLAPFLTEMTYAAGAGDRLVGVSRHSDVPAAARTLPVISDAVQVDFERVVSLQPDLVLAWVSGNPVRNVRALDRLGLPVFAVEPARLADIPRLLRAIGTLAGTTPAAARAAADFERALMALRARHAGGPPVRTFYEIWRRPLTTVNGAHLVSDVFRLCGGVNVFESATALVPTVSFEALIAARPAVIVGGGPEGPEAFTRDWRRSLAAIRGYEPRLVYVDPALLQSLSPRVLEGAERVCAALEAARKP